ncbi:MAG: hypothetical protein ACHBNF_19090 [Chromatiales bacterium]
MARGGTEAFHFRELGLKKVALALNEREIEMATRLVKDLTGDPSKYRDTYREDLLARVKALTDGTLLVRALLDELGLRSLLDYRREGPAHRGAC